jgi:Uncharacterized conserved protein
MKTIALIEKGKDGTYGIYTPDINSTIIGSGDTVAEAKADFENSVQEIFAAYREHGDELPKELQGISFEYKHDLASLFNYYSWINVTQFAKIAGINAGLMRRHKAGDTYISKAQTQKIERALHKLGEELAAVRL